MRSAEEHLAELRADGATVVPNVIDEASISALEEKVIAWRRDQYPDDEPFDGEFRFQSALLFSEEVARAVTNPLALAILREYLGTGDIHFGHQPAIIVLKPAREMKGTFPPSGWHTDYPYHPGVFPDEEWPASPPLGAQFNICLDPFTAETGATQYVPAPIAKGARRRLHSTRTAHA
ncbi:MAG: phytanoyl-CoA dioxygenase family protein [Gammaproteobacteria bacterium]|nr:phytanoyl-CoA dioxygenase family protein [Gammaproteobacteria bacterium]